MTTPAIVETYSGASQSEKEEIVAAVNRVLMTRLTDDEFGDGSASCPAGQEGVNISSEYAESDTRIVITITKT